MTTRVRPAAASIQVGSARVATRLVVDQTGPASLALLRYVLGACCLVPAMFGAWLLGEPVTPLAALGPASLAMGLALAHLDSERRRAL